MLFVQTQTARDKTRTVRNKTGTYRDKTGIYRDKTGISRGKNRNIIDKTMTGTYLVKSLNLFSFLIRPSPKGRPLQECPSVVVLVIVLNKNQVRPGIRPYP